jgi:hypothetical protein
MKARANPELRNFAGAKPLELTIGCNSGYGARSAIAIIENRQVAPTEMLNELFRNVVRRTSDVPWADVLVQKLLARNVSPTVLTAQDFRLMRMWNGRTNRREGKPGFPERSRRVLRLLERHGCVIPPELLVEML